MARHTLVLMPRQHGKTTVLRAALRRMGIHWPGDGDYGYGTDVYIIKTQQVVRLIARLDEPGHYKTEGGAVYVEKKTATGIVQELRGQERRPKDVTLAGEVSTAIATYLSKRGQPPNVLHISYDDLVKLGQERLEIAEQGNAWGLTIALLPKGEKLSVDRRIDL